MKKLPSHYLLIVFFVTLLISSCSKDNDPNAAPCSIGWATDLQNEITALSDAMVAFSLDESAENCNALKAAYRDYIDALRPYGDCATLTGSQRAEWQDALNEAEADLAGVC
jgi:hypothetical protein